MRAALCLIALLTGSVVLAETPRQQREWLLARLIVDMQGKGVYSAQQYAEIERKIEAMSDSQIAVIVQYYLQAKEKAEDTRLQRAQAQAYETQAELKQARAYRDRLQQQLEMIRAQQELQYHQSAAAITQFGGQVITEHMQAATLGWGAKGDFGGVYYGPVVTTQPTVYLRTERPHHPHHPWNHSPHQFGGRPGVNPSASSSGNSGSKSVPRPEYGKRIGR